MTKPHRSPDTGYRGAFRAQVGWSRHLLMPLNLFIGAACLAALVAIWLATTTRIAYEREQALGFAMRSNATLALAFEQQVARTLKTAEQIASFVRDEYLQQNGHIDLPLWVEKHIIREAMFTFISVVNENGEVVSSSNQTAEQTNYADRSFFLAQRDATRDELYISSPVLGRISHRWQTPMSLRISRPDGSFAGVVVVSVDPAEFSDLYQEVDLGRQGLLELAGLDGVVYTRRVGDDIRFARDNKSLPWFRRRAAVPEGSFVEYGQAADGVSRILSYRTMSGYPLMLTVGTAYDETMARPHRRWANYRLIAGSASVVLVGLAALLMIALARQRVTTDALQSSQAVFSATFHQAAMGIAHVAPDGRILGVNEKFCRMLGYDHDTLCTLNLMELNDTVSEHPLQQFQEQYLSASQTEPLPEVEKPYRRKDGSLLWVCEALAVVRDTHGRPDFLVVVVQDVTERKNLEARLSYDAQHDALTGLPNRARFQKRLNRIILAAPQSTALAGVLFIDLDGFKAVNDTHGHAAGDLLLQQVAQRLQASLRAEDTVARFGGDEFGVVLPTLGSQADAENVAEKIITALAQPFDLGVAEVHISGSVGGALFPLHGTDAIELLAHADAAMYTAKHSGKSRFCWEPASANQSA